MELCVTLTHSLKLTQSITHTRDHTHTTQFKHKQINAYVDLVSSPFTQVPYSYHDLGFCPPPTSFINKRTSSLGSKLQGGGISLTHYTFEGKGVEACQVLCAKSLSAKEVDKLRGLVERGYRAHFLLDSLPVVMRSVEFDYVVRGFPLGFKAGGEVWGGQGEEVRRVGWWGWGRGGEHMSFDFLVASYIQSLPPPTTPPNSSTFSITTSASWSVITRMPPFFTA